MLLSTKHNDPHAIGSARRPAPTTLFHVRGRNLATELSLWPGQSCGTVCQRQFVTRTVHNLLNADSNRTFLAFVLVTDSVMSFRSGFAHWRALNSPFYSILFYSILKKMTTGITAIIRMQTIMRGSLTEIRNSRKKEMIMKYTRYCRQKRLPRVR